MTPKAKEQRSAGELEEDTCTRRKRSRRVSFAETTIHVFKRDDESESPGNSTPVPSEGCGLSDNEGTVGFGGIQSQGDDSVESAPEDEVEDGARLRFVRDIDLSSPGSAAGSVTSNEDDNFFGPVSASFINSGHLSDSGMPDDNNHDITLDSTAFSLHFRNIVPPDDQSANSAGSLRTPTGDTTSTMPLGFLVGRDQTEELSSKSSVGQVSNVSVDWNTINPNIGGSHNYDYGKLSLTLEALMNEVNLRMQHKSPIGDCRFITSSCQTDEVGSKKKLLKVGEQAVNQNSCCDEPGRSIHHSISPIAPPISNESLLRAKAKALTNHSNNEIIKVKQTQTLDFSAISQCGLMHDAARQQFVSPRRELMDHGERISAIKNHITRSNVKSRGPSEYGPTPSSISDVNLGATEVNDSKQTEDMVIIRDLNCSGNSSCLTKLDKRAALESMDISMETPDNTVKAFQFSTLKGSVSSYQDKQRQRQYHSVMCQPESLHSSARELSASLKMELKVHEERISAIETSITRSRSKSRMQTDCEAAPLMKDLFITNLQGILKKINDDPYMKHAGFSNVNIDANEVTAAKQLEGLGIVKDLDCSRNSSYLLGLDKNVAVMETVEKGQSEKCIEFFRDSSLKLHHTVDLCGSSIDQREADLKESNKDISSKFELGNKEKIALSSEGCVTSGVDEIASSRDLLDRKSLQPASSLVSSSVEKVSNGEKLKLAVNSGTLLHYEKTDVDSKCIDVGGLYFNKKMTDTLANRPKKVIEKPMIDPCKAPGEVLEANKKSSKLLEFSAEKIVHSPNNHFLNKIDLVSPKKSQAALSFFHGPRHQNTESQQETYCGYDVAVIGDIGKMQTCYTENAGYSESCRMQNSPATVPEAIGDSVILSVDHMHHDEALDIADKAPLKRWTDVFYKLSDTTNQLLPPSTSELGLQKLDDMESLLESLLDELQTARKYEGLCISLRNNKRCSLPNQKKVIDARSLLEMLGIAEARKQLKCMKLKKMRNKANILQSQVEECGKLKSIYAQVRDLCRRVVESDEPSDCRHQEEQNRLTAMKQEHGILEQNIKLLLNSFESSCKLTGKISCNDVIKAVDEHVMRKAFCKKIQQHVLLGKLCDVVMENDHYEIILDYCNLLFQRFTIKKSRFSSIVTNTLSNTANIIKKYPNMNACTAFEFVFKLNVDQKLVNSTCIYERTMETNLLMGTLIDVLEEILLSRLELLNLIFSTFLKQSSGELELQLCFHSSSSGRKLILGINMSSLNCGIYPSDPSELKIQVCEQQTTLPSSIVNKAIAAVRNLECGHLMLLRLCRCVSQVIQCFC